MLRPYKCKKAVREEVREDVGVKHHDHADDGAKRQRMPNDEAKDDPFIANLVGGG